MNNLRELRIRKNISVKEMVAVVWNLYHKFDKTKLSNCESGAYGENNRKNKS